MIPAEPRVTARTKAVGARTNNGRRRLSAVIVWVCAAVVLFIIGRLAAAHGVDFRVCYYAARSFLAGRTDLYSDNFAYGFAMAYPYPPLYLLLVFPIGWLSVANAYAIWFALMGLATFATLRQAYRLWRPQSRVIYGWLVASLAAPFLFVAFLYGNAHVLVLLLLVVGVMAWARKKPWTCAAALALGGAIKLFPLFLAPVFLLRREWKILGRLILLSGVLWALPAVYFGPRATVALYRTWNATVAGNLNRFERFHPLDQSVIGAVERRLTAVNYASRRDSNYPEVNIAQLPARLAHALAVAVALAILAATLWMFFKLRDKRSTAALSPSEDSRVRVAISAVLFITAQLILGPCTPPMYFSGWLLAAILLPSILPVKSGASKALLAISVANVFLVALPGAKMQRALQAGGAYTLVGVALWALAMYLAWKTSAGRLAFSAR